MGASLVNWLTSATVLHVRVWMTAIGARYEGVARDLRCRRREVWSGTLLFLCSSAPCFASDRGPLVYSALRYLQVGREKSIEPSSRPAPEPAQSLPVAPPACLLPEQDASLRAWLTGPASRLGSLRYRTVDHILESTRPAFHHAQRRFHHPFIAPEGYRWVSDR